MKLLCISDFHIGGAFNQEMFDKGLNLVNTLESDFVICCGDVTDSGTLQNYKLAIKQLKKFKKPVLLVPGNHDAKNVGYLLWEEFIGPRYFVKTDEDKKIKILGLDSNEPDANTGRMGRKAIERIYQEFMDLDQSWTKILVSHHQTLPIPYTGRERSAVNDAGDVIKAIMDCNIDLVLNGHRHITNVYRISDGDFQSLIVNVGTLSCKKTRYKEEYSITAIDFNSENTKIDVIQLNHPKPKILSKFSGSLRELPYPKNNMELISTIVQFGATDFGNSKFNLEMFAKGIKLINSIQCEFVIHCGNITSSSYKQEFRSAKALLSQLVKPLVAIPGPQDSKPLGFELFPDKIGDMNPIMETEQIKLFGFNSCILDEKIGRLGRENSRMIISGLSSTEKISVVAFHHTLIPLPKTKHEAELTDAGDVLAMIVNNNINLVLTGAKNRAECWKVNETVFVNAGTLSSYKVNTIQGNSFNIISIFKTDEGIYFEIDEVLLDLEQAQKIGRFHINYASAKVTKRSNVSSPKRKLQGKKSKKAKKRR
jgi:3',5'-cyclic AMP phosphodiesterase CpdA